MNVVELRKEPQGEGTVMPSDRKRRDPFVRALLRILAERDMDIKGLSKISKINDQTIRKLIREGAGSNKIRQAIAAALGFQSFAELYLLEEKPKSNKGDPEVVDRILERLDQIENRFDGDVRSIRNQIDLLTRALLERPFVPGAGKKAN